MKILALFVIVLIDITLLGIAISNIWSFDSRLGLAALLIIVVYSIRFNIK